MSNPSNLKYTASHEWVKTEADGTITVGITQHAQELLGDMVFVEAPAAGSKLNAKEECAVVESVKAAADVYALSHLYALPYTDRPSAHAYAGRKDPEPASLVAGCGRWAGFRCDSDPLAQAAL